MEETELFARLGSDYARAHTVLLSGCEVPPSFEVFSAELAEYRKRFPGCSATDAAAQISRNYRRLNVPE